MGCGGSKVDDYPLVTLCRERKELIRAATEHRYALASAHISYFRSLRDVGDALRRFVDEEILIASTSPLDSPGPPRPAPPSPPSPKVSAWDFFNPFDSYDSVYPSYYSHSRYGSAAGSSPDSKEVREREGIPDLEDETEQEVTKKVYRNGKKPNDFVNKNSGEGEGTSRSVPMQCGEDTSWKVPSKESENTQSDQRKEGKEIKSSPDTIVSESSEEGSRKKKSVSFEEPSVRDIESSKQSSRTTLSAHGTRDLKEVVKEIRDGFETASGCGKEVSMLLEVGKLPYQARGTLFKGDNGTIDGQGALWWTKFYKGELKYTRPYLIEIMYSDNVQISSLTLLDSPSWNVHPVYSSDVLIQGLTITAPVTSPNLITLIMMMPPPVKKKKQ